MVVISMRFDRMRSQRFVGSMFVQPMSSSKSGIFMRLFRFFVASLLAFSHVLPGWIWTIREIMNHKKHKKLPPKREYRFYPSARRPLL